jgi:hypothetical protein
MEGDKVKKARTIKVDGEEWKYFFDANNKYHDGGARPEIVFYAPDKKTKHRVWIGFDVPKMMTSAMAKEILKRNRAEWLEDERVETRKKTP